MNKLFAASILIIFLGIAVFGFFNMDMSNGHNCLASGMDPNSPCPNPGWAMGIFHVEAFRSFLAATFGIGILSLILAFVVWSIAVTQPLVEPLSRFEFSFLEPKQVRYKTKFISWFSIHENSPSYIFQA